MSLWLLIPVKPFAESKTRLASVLAPHERTALSRQLLHDVLARSRAAAQFDHILVISRDPAVLTLAAALGAQTLRESPHQVAAVPMPLATAAEVAAGIARPHTPSYGESAPARLTVRDRPSAPAEARLNAALRAGRAHACAAGAHGILVLPADLPLLTEHDLTTLATALRPAVSAPKAGHVVLAPSHDGGTNALGLAPPHAIDFAFGPQSFDRHRALAQTATCTVTVVRSPTLDYDLDLPEDLWGEDLGI